MRGVHVGIMASSHVFTDFYAGTDVYDGFSAAFSSSFDCIDSNPATTDPFVVVASSSVTASSSQAAGWLSATPNNTYSAALAYFVGGNPGDPSYGTVSLFSVYNTQVFAWVNFQSIVVLDDSTVVAYLRIQGGSFDLGDGVSRTSGYYLVHYSYPGLIPTDVKKLTYAATSGAGDAIDLNQVYGTLTRTGSDEVQLLFFTDSALPGTWTLGGVGATIGLASGSTVNTTYQTNLMFFRYVPSTATVTNATGYGVTPSPNSCTGFSPRTDLDPLTGYIWTSFAPTLKSNANPGMDTMTFDAQTYTASRLTTYPTLFGWDPATRTCIKLLVMTGNTGGLRNICKAGLSSHGGATRIVLMVAATQPVSSRTLTWGGVSFLMTDSASFDAQAAGVYNATTDTVEVIMDAASAGHPIPSAHPLWTGSRWYIPYSSTAPTFVTETGPSFTLPAATAIPNVTQQFQNQEPLGVAVAGGAATVVASGDALWLVNRWIVSSTMFFRIVRVVETA